jgi:hypothetical protein
MLCQQVEIELEELSAARRYPARVSLQQRRRAADLPGVLAAVRRHVGLLRVSTARAFVACDAALLWDCSFSSTTTIKADPSQDCV